MRFSAELKTAELRITISDWITGLMGIFFSIWWSFTFQEIISQDLTTFTIQVPLFGQYVPVPSLAIIGVSVLYICSFAYYYVYWLWTAQLYAVGRAYRKLIANSASLFFALLGIMSTMGFLNISNPGVSQNLMLYGFFITMGWPVVVFISLVRRR